MSSLEPVLAENPREIAARAFRRRRAGGEYIETVFESVLATARLSPADRALCQELVFGVVRWTATLDWLVARKTAGRVQKPALQDLLRLGLYQLFWLDRVPDHAAVHETVEQAKRSGFGPQAGFVNAVLRDYLRERDVTERLLAELKTTQPHLGCSHPEWLVKKWQARFGEEHTRKVLDWNNTPPRTFARVNTLKFGGASVLASRFAGNLATPENAGNLLARWRAEDVEYDFIRRDWFDENLVFELKSHPPLADLPSFREGWFYVQDPSTLLAVRELDPKPGEAVLDLCAAPGGKTTFIAQLMGNQGKVVASDVSEERLRLLRENCSRLGVTCVEPIQPSAFSLQPSAFDRVLVDAPCSNTGVMRRRADLRWRIRPEEIERLRTAQLDLLRQAAATLKPTGALVYSTCSLEPEENGEVVKMFLSEWADFKLEHERELLPFTDGVDGAYVARLAKSP